MHNFSYNIESNYTTKGKSSKNKISLKVFLVFLIFFTTILFLLFRKTTRTKIINPVIIPTITPTPVIKIKEQSSKGLLEKIQKKVDEAQGTYSIYIYDINNAKEIGINENMVLSAASINKIPILATLYYLAGIGKIDLEKIIIPQPADIQDYGTGSIRYDPTGTPYSIKTLARLMMEKSDNTAAYLLASIIIGLDKIQNQVESWGLSQTDMKINNTSNKDMALLLIKMYKGEITNKALTSEMLDFMDKSDFEDRLPTGVNDEIKIYHKIGDDIGKIHDVGIFDLPSNPYYLGVLTSDITNEEETKKFIADISSLVYNYMKKL